VSCFFDSRCSERALVFRTFQWRRQWKSTNNESSWQRKWSYGPSRAVDFPLNIFIHSFSDERNMFFLAAALVGWIGEDFVYMQNFIQIGLGVSVLRNAWFRAPRHKVTRLFFVPWERLQPKRAHRFWRKIRQTTQFRASKCLLGVAKPKSKVSTPIPPQKKPPFLGPISDLEFFRPKTALTLDCSRVNDP